MSVLGPDRLLAGRYRLGELLGRGGMAEVRAARDERLDRDVAVKILRPELAVDPLVRQRFESEARTSARLSHPNVVNVFDAGSEDDSVFMVMERLPGQTLDDELAGGPLPLGRVSAIGAQVLAALGAAHAADIVHRDIKPANVLTCPDGQVKVADFGIATVLGAASVTATGLIIGTPAYLAPERAGGQAASVRSDLYSVGALLYTCLTGRRPFEADSAVALMVVMQSRDATPLSELRPDTPPHLVGVVERAMAKDPDERFGSAEEMAAALASVPFAEAPAPPGLDPTASERAASVGGLAPVADATAVMAAAGMAAAAGIGAAGAADIGGAGTRVVSRGPGPGPGPGGRGFRLASILLVGAAVVVVLVALGAGLIHSGTGNPSPPRRATSTSTTGSATTTSTAAPTTSAPTSTSTTAPTASTTVTVTIPSTTTSPPTTSAPSTSTPATAPSITG